MLSISMTPQKLRVLIKTTVQQELASMLNDPDFGLELKPSFIKRLKQSVKSEKAGRLTDINDVIAQLKLDA